MFVFETVAKGEESFALDTITTTCIVGRPGKGTVVYSVQLTIYAYFYSVEICVVVFKVACSYLLVRQVSY